MRSEIIEKVQTDRIIAIVRGVYGEDGLRLAEALYAGGIKLIEFTFDQLKPQTLPDTKLAVKNINTHFGDAFMAGAGTVTSVSLVEHAFESGAKFIVSPNRNSEVIRRTVELGMVSIPGALTPSEALEAHEAGADFVKLFPISVLGPAYVTAIIAPLNHIKFLAVGGIDESNVGDYLKAGCLGAGVGGKLVNKEIIAQGKFSEITEQAKRLVAASR